MRRLMYCRKIVKLHSPDTYYIFEGDIAVSQYHERYQPAPAAYELAGIAFIPERDPEILFIVINIAREVRLFDLREPASFFCADALKFLYESAALVRHPYDILSDQDGDHNRNGDGDPYYCARFQLCGKNDGDRYYPRQDDRTEVIRGKHQKGVGYVFYDAVMHRLRILAPVFVRRKSAENACNSERGKQDRKRDKFICKVSRYRDSLIQPCKSVFKRRDQVKGCYHGVLQIKGPSVKQP